MSIKELKNYAYYSDDRISSFEIEKNFYIGVDNMLPNKLGITKSQYNPLEGNLIKFQIGDILLSNIRPYFKKIWLATFDGAASPDVLVIRPFDCNLSEFIYSSLSQDTFFDYDMMGSKGTKMPRGDKNHIMEFPIQDVNNKHNIGSLICNFNRAISANISINDNLSYSSMVA